MRGIHGVMTLAVLSVVASACASGGSDAVDVPDSVTSESELLDADIDTESDTDTETDGEVDVPDSVTSENELLDADADAGTDSDGEVDEPDSTDVDVDVDDGGADGPDDELATQTSAIFAEYDGEGPGCVVGIRSAGESQVMAFGMADIEAAEPLTAESIFDIGSVSKQFTAGAVALLVTDGDLALDTEVSSIVNIEPFGALVSVSDLVHHTSGLPDYTELLDAGDDEVTTNDDVIDLVSADGFELAFEPGTAFEYSNTNYVLLSEIVADVSGESLVGFSVARIFEPLGMSDSVVRDDQGDLLTGQAQGYAGDDGNWTPVGSSWQQTGDGAIHATIPDLLRWADLFLPGASDVGGGLGSPAWQQQMLEPGKVDDDGSQYAFGIGIEDGGNILAHAGSWIGYSSALTIEPSADVAVVVSCNIDDIDADELSREVLAVWATS